LPYDTTQHDNTVHERHDNNIMTVPYVQPYVHTDDSPAILVEEEDDDDDVYAPYVKDSSTKKKKKKKSSTDPYTDSLELTAMKPKSSKKKKKKDKKPKSMRSTSNKTTQSNDSSTSYSKPYSSEDPAVAHLVMDASGWEPLIASDMHAKQDSDHQYAITGSESQIVTITIPPGTTAQGEPGSMMYLSSPVSMKVRCGSDWMGRCIGGESCCILDYRNNSHETGHAGLVSNGPLGKVVPIEMSSPSINNTLIVQKGAYMASYGDVTLDFDLDCNIVRCCCGGMGLVRQKIKGTGTAFLGAIGTIVQKVLEPDEVMLVDQNCILAYAGTCTFTVKKIEGVMNWIGAGEGIFNTSIQGPGLVVIQSINMPLLLEALAADKMYRR